MRLSLIIPLAAILVIAMATTASSQDAEASPSPKSFLERMRDRVQTAKEAKDAVKETVTTGVEKHVAPSKKFNLQVEKVLNTPLGSVVDSVNEMKEQSDKAVKEEHDKAVLKAERMLAPKVE